MEVEKERWREAREKNKIKWVCVTQRDLKILTFYGWYYKHLPTEYAHKI